MRWYEGGIAEAVSLSRKNNSIFVVYVEGNDDRSAELTKIIDANEISSKLEGDSFVAIKIEANSLAHQQFSEIYNRVNAPSIYFIGKSGAPLEIIEGTSGIDELGQKIDDLLRKNGYAIDSKTPNKSQITSDFILQEKKTETADTSAGAPSGSGAEIEVMKTGGEALPVSGAQASVTETASVSAPEANTIKTGEVTETSIASTGEEAASSSRPETNTGEAGGEETNTSDKTVEFKETADSELTHEDKVERAKAIIEKKRLEKQHEEEEREKNKEVERRKMGQDVQKLKRWQQDQELKNIIEEREREKKEQQAARQRILAQIEQDKADRAARFSAGPSQAPPQPTPKTPTSTNTARLQFKLPDGSTHTREFSNTSSLAEVRNYIKANLSLSFNNFALATAFPRREFTAGDDFQSLQDLELVPTAVVLILPLTHGTVASSPNTFATFLWYLVAPFLNVLGYIKSMFFGERRPRSPEPSTSQENKRPYDGSGPESSRPFPKRRVGETSVIRRQGNVHRLTDKSDSDDENNTWNGNSTQQM